MLIDIGNVDWGMLRSQKSGLLKLAEEEEHIGNEKEALDGVIVLLDHIQDEAAKQLSEKEVFGKTK